MLFFVLFASLCTLTVQEYRVVGYFEAWAVYRPGAGKFDVEDVNPHTVTHLNYGFAGLNAQNKIYSLDPWNDLEKNYGRGAFKRFTKLKEQNPKLKTLLSIGGWNEGSTKYSKMASSAASRETFAESCVEFLQEFGFDGLDLDWEYPTMRGGKPEDKANYVLLMKELHDKFQPHGLLLTAAVSDGKDKVDAGYDVAGIAKYVDWLNIMCYDYHGDWESYVGINAPMYVRPGETGTDATLNINFTINYYLQQGLPKEKMTLGVAYYGHGFNLQDPSKIEPYSKSSGPIQGGQFTREAGMWAYYEICKGTANWDHHWDDAYECPYTNSGRQWMGYDNLKSMKIKMDFIKDHGLSGAMSWAVDMDDFRGTCGTKEPLGNLVWRELNGAPVVPTTTLPTTTPEGPTTTTAPATTVTGSTVTETTVTETTATATTTAATTTTMAPSTTVGPTPGPDGICKKEGLNPDPEPCSPKFYNCHLEPTHNEWHYTPFHCGEGTIFDPVHLDCTWPYNVPGCGGEEGWYSQVYPQMVVV